MRARQIVLATLGAAAAAVVGFLAWAQQRDIAALKIRPGKDGAREAAFAYAELGPHSRPAVPPRATRWAGRGLLALLAIVVVAGLAFVSYAWHPAIDPVATPARDSFTPKQIARGSQLAQLGYCNVCHTKHDGLFYAGGRPVPTPFGTIYATNITPDAETGIGRWSFAAFERAMHEGVDRGGRHLYPAFPYDHFTRVTSDDLRALYAYLMTREPVHARTPANEVPFPLNIRMAVAGWKLFFFDRGQMLPVAGHDDQWNHGRYLADGLAHCGGCHTPRNRLGAERKGQYFAGGESENWNAPPLDASSPAPAPWTAEAIFAYLRNGHQADHGTATGPMAPVAENLAQVPEADVRAIAAYVASVFGEPPPGQARKVRDLIATRGVRETVGAAPSEGAADPAEALYAGACGTCHGETNRSRVMSALPLALSTALASPDPRNAAHVVLEGIQPLDDERGALMPGFATALTEAQIVDLLGYARRRFTGKPPWPDLGRQVRAIRTATGQN